MTKFNYIFKFTHKNRRCACTQVDGGGRGRQDWMWIDFKLFGIENESSNPTSKMMGIRIWQEAAEKGGEVGGPGTGFGPPN